VKVLIGPAPIIVPPSKMLQHFGEAYDAESSVDTVLLCGAGRDDALVGEVRCHRFILTNFSAHFRRALPPAAPSRGSQLPSCGSAMMPDSITIPDRDVEADANADVDADDHLGGGGAAALAEAKHEGWSDGEEAAIGGAIQQAAVEEPMVHPEAAKLVVEFMYKGTTSVPPSLLVYVIETCTRWQLEALVLFKQCVRILEKAKRKVGHTPGMLRAMVAREYQAHMQAEMERLASAWGRGGGDGDSGGSGDDDVDSDGDGDDDGGGDDRSGDVHGEQNSSESRGVGHMPDRGEVGIVVGVGTADEGTSTTPQPSNGEGSDAGSVNPEDFEEEIFQAAIQLLGDKPIAMGRYPRIVSKEFAYVCVLECGCVLELRPS